MMSPESFPMHCLVTWGKRAGEPPLSQEQHADLEQAFSGHSWVRAFPGAYVVGLLYGERERTELLDGIRELLHDGLEDVIVVASPAMPRDTGLYNGAAPSHVWDAIN